MGKISTKDAKDKMRHKPLYKDITETGHLKVGKRLKHDKTVEEDAEDDFVLDAASSRKVLKLAREQQEEIALEENRLEVSERPRFQMIAHESDESDDDAVYEAMSDDDENEYYDEEVEEVDEQDAKLFESYFKSENNAFGSFNLADKVMSKLQETQQQKAEQTEKPQDKVFLPPRVIEAYEKVGQSLHVWRHGKLPKLFKVLPSIKNWEDLIFVTNPEAWTPQVTYEATRLFVSNLTASKAERFVNLVLYPKVRQDIEESEEHKLNYHLYRSLKKSLYKPAAFFRGFLFPLIEDGCTTREAMIVGSILTKCSIPVQHSAVALSWLLQKDFNPATTVFIRILIEKKYALPYQTIDDLVFYFMRFQITEQRQIRDASPMPLVWHKAFLAFAQRYKNDITEDQRDFLMEVVRQRGHREIGPEIRRELRAGKERSTATGKEDKEDDIMSFF
ncbi:uncharacterized protein OGAPODRAFT_101242 [Ogataea polymorpha]|uniref:uncharacterized protein n=1 Tax=Ogataea polymorpha TaxID=460523 RepID=UPI0007F33DE0|nr:uncharacterized protein OGAPODRAFT_101242 [Ogataea polymorpha]OBA14788.1 hypothetical protein OGAPODRAFT_101242 [Ogataea polymorpha]